MARTIGSSAPALHGLCFGAAASLAAIAFSPAQANAYVVTVGGVQYNVTTFTGSYNANASNFDLPANGGVMPWWGNTALASDFATQVSSFFGYPNGPGIGCATSCGPFFGYAANLGSFPNHFSKAYARTAEGPVNDVVAQPQTASFTWAQVSPVTTPGPLPLLGAAAACGFSRRLRTRIQTSRHPLASQVLRT
jgi:hypothetical protein